MPDRKEKNVRRIVIRELPHFWLFCVLSAIMALVIQIIGLIPPILMQRIIDMSISSKNTREVLMSIFWFCIIPVCATSLATFYQYILAVSCRRFGQGLSIKGFQNLLYQPLSYFDSMNSSELAAYCQKEALQYVVFWIIDIPQLIATLLSAAVVLVYILQLNGFIGTFLLFYIPFSFFPSNHFANKIQNLTKRIMDNNAKTAQTINDTFKGIKFIKSMALEKLQIKKLREVNEDSVSIWSRAAVYDNLSGLWVNELSDKLFTGVTFAAAAFFIIGSKMSLGALVIILNYTAKFIAASKELTHTNYDFKKQLGSYDQLFDILLMQPQETEGDKPFDFQSDIVFKNVQFAYEKERGEVLKGLDLTVHKGEWLGIMGPSGAGKTTVFDLLMRLYSPQQGKVTVDGISIEDIAVDATRNKITKVSQDTFLFPGTIRENLEMVNPEASEKDLWKALEAVYLKDFTANLENGLDTEIGENGLLLSGGEKQRLGLAQGLLRNSEILLLDEVTANIDAAAETVIMNILRDINKQKNLTIIAVSHRLEFLAHTDRILVLGNGKVDVQTSYKAIKEKSYSGEREVQYAE